MTDIVTAEDIALRLLGSESKSSLIPRWRKRHSDFPEPIKASPKIIIWDWNDIEAWARATGRLDDQGQPIRPSTDPTQKRRRMSTPLPEHLPERAIDLANLVNTLAELVDAGMTPTEIEPMFATGILARLDPDA